MNTEKQYWKTQAARFRSRLFTRIAVSISAITIVGILASHHYLSKSRDEALRARLEKETQATNEARRTRQLILTEICEALSRKSRIRAALEDDALDLLYPSAKDELSIVFKPNASRPYNTYKALFYRFLDHRGQLIEPLSTYLAGEIPGDSGGLFAFKETPSARSVRYARIESANDAHRVVEMFTTPIRSSSTNRPIATLVVAFPLQLDPALVATKASSTFETCVLFESKVAYTTLPKGLHAQIESEAQAIVESHAAGKNMGTVHLGQRRFRYVARTLSGSNPKNRVLELTLLPTDELEIAQSAATTNIVLVAAALLIAGFGLSHLAAKRISRPVERLAEAGRVEEEQRLQAERELERAARFSADASHQLKTPVTALRAGLQSLIEDPTLTSENREEVNHMLRQTTRLSNVIDDLLLLSRLDAGQVRLKLEPIDLALMIEELVDDLSILPGADSISVTTDLPARFWALGDRSFTMLILQNLLENARKYNRTDGRIEITGTTASGKRNVAVGNTGNHIPDAAKEHIFERFHRASAGENVQGYGLGLNLAHELARLHSGTLVLSSSKPDWTVFELQLQAAQPPERHSLQ